MQLPKTVVVIGGTGFVGRYVVKSLVSNGFRVKVICRSAADAEISALKTCGGVGQVAYAAGNLAHIESITPHLTHAFAVVNLVGILYESGRKQSFSRIHAHGAEKLAQAAKKAGVQVYVHMSALGADRAKATYSYTKLLGEKAVQAAFPEATIIRPSIIFGAEDNFFNQFAEMAMALHVLPLIGGGNTCFQPVFVGDVAEVIVQSILQPARAAGRIFELGGPRSLTFRQIMEYVLQTTGRHAHMLNLGWATASMMGLIAQLLPRPVLTHDQVKLLKFDNVVSGNFPGMEALGIRATTIETIVPHYLKRFRKGGK